MNEWTTTLPTAPGHYWTWHTYARKVYLTELVEKHGTLYEEISGLVIGDFPDDVQFSGPLSVPEPPGVSDERS